MRFRSSNRKDRRRREPRAEAFRSQDLVASLRAELAPWFKEEGFKRLGSNGWVRRRGEEHVIVVVQCSQGGWENRSGNKFVIEFERSRTPNRGTGLSRSRIWNLLDELSRHEALSINTEVAQTLPPPNMRFVSELPGDVREQYLKWFAPSSDTTDSHDVWFAYYDEVDAARWARFLATRIDPALEDFLARPPSFFGFSRPSEDV